MSVEYGKRLVELLAEFDPACGSIAVVFADRNLRQRHLTLATKLILKLLFFTGFLFAVFMMFPNGAVSSSDDDQLDVLSFSPTFGHCTR